MGFESRHPSSHCEEALLTVQPETATFITICNNLEPEILDVWH